MYKKELKHVLKILKKVAPVQLKYYNGKFNVEIKEDNSPVTEADKVSDRMLSDYLKSKFPEYGFLTEETYNPNNKERLSKDYVWIIDPLDGTKDFVSHDGNFTINVALCYKHEIVLGAVMIPLTNTIYYAVQGEGAYKKVGFKKSKIHVSNKTKGLTCLTSIFHSSDDETKTIEKHKDKITNVSKAGSSLKACLIAEGKAEISYRLSPGTKEWDTAAFDLIVREAGGYVLKLNKERMTYNREDVRNLEGYIIINSLENFLL